MINPIIVVYLEDQWGKLKELIILMILIYNIIIRIWMKLNINLKMCLLPSKRAAHASATNDSMQMVIYSGSSSIGLFYDKLWILHLSEQNEGIWSEVRFVGQTLAKDINIKNKPCQWGNNKFHE